MALQAKLVQFGSAQFPLLGHEVGADTLVYQPIIIAPQHATTKWRPGAILIGRTQRNPGHRLNSPCDHNVIRSANHTLRGKVNRLLTRPTLAINRSARYHFGKVRREYGVASHVETLLSNLTHTTYNDILYHARINASPLDQC